MMTKIQCIPGVGMSANYDKLWKLLIDRKLTKTEMRIKAGISTNVLAKMGKGETISLDSLGKIAIALQCGLDDIVDIVPDKSSS